EIDVREGPHARAQDEPQHHVGPEAALCILRLEEAVDGGITIVEHIDEAGAGEDAMPVAELDEAGLEPAVLHHGAVVAEGHRGHLAVGMAEALVAGEEAVLLAGGARLGLAADEVEVEPGDAPRRAPGAKAQRGDADRHAGGATGAARAICQVMAAAE